MAVLQCIEIVLRQTLYTDFSVGPNRGKQLTTTVAPNTNNIGSKAASSKHPGSDRTTELTNQKTLDHP